MMSDDPQGAEKLKHYEEALVYIEQLTKANKVLISTLNQTQEQLVKMFKADTQCGCGFEETSLWRKAYFNLQIMAQYKGVTFNYTPMDGELPTEIVE